MDDKMRLVINRNGYHFEPPVKEDVQIEWEKSGSCGKLTFTVVKVTNGDMAFNEGDQVLFYYEDKLIFVGYVFTKKRDRKHHIEVTCYDQIRYLKNKYTYVFENKTATQIIQMLCKDFNLEMGEMEDTKYVIPVVAEENKSALDIILDVLEETLLNTGNMFVFYDQAGKLTLKNSANMVSDTLIMKDTAENFDYTSSIDDETYNSVVLYYKGEDNQISLYTANNEDRLKQWGTLRYFEEVKNKTTAMNKAKSLLNLYCKKKRELKVTGAFGDINVRGGTLIPVQLYLGDIDRSSYMLVEKASHSFKLGHYSMDLTLGGAWEDDNYGKVNYWSEETEDTNGGNGFSIPKVKYGVNIECYGIKTYAGEIRIGHTYDGKSNSTNTLKGVSSGVAAMCDEGTKVQVAIYPMDGHSFVIYNKSGTWTKSGENMYTISNIKQNSGFTVKWVE